MSRILGIDFGHKRVGFALSDESRTIATPYGTYDNQADLIQQIVLLVEEEDIDEVVVGKPLTLRGNKTDSYRRAELFFIQLQRALPKVKFAWQDERLSTQEVKLQRIRSNWSLKKRRSKKDAQAAANILQVYLDQK